jgi:hypothetical protein
VTPGGERAFLRHPGDLIGAVLFMLLGAAAAYKAYTFGLGTTAEPGAGFMPFWASLLMLGCASATAVDALLARSAPASNLAAEPVDAGHPIARPHSYKKVWLCVLTLALYAAALPWFGFVISTFAVILALSRFDPKTSWPGAVVIAALGALGFWAIFVRGLGVNFPTAPFGF